MGSLFELHWLSCSMAYGILVPQPEIEPASPALQSRFLTTGPPGKFPCWIFRTQINSTHFPSKVWNPTETFLKSTIDFNGDQNKQHQYLSRTTGNYDWKSSLSSHSSSPTKWNLFTRQQRQRRPWWVYYTERLHMAWRIPWTEEPSRPQSMELQKIGHDWVTFTFFSHLKMVKMVHLLVYIFDLKILKKIFEEHTLDWG